MNCIRGALFGLLTLLGSVAIFGQQDITVEWKTSLSDLDRRLAAMPSSGSSGAEAWRTDAEALLSSVSSFAAGHPELKLQVPAPLAANTSPQDPEAAVRETEGRRERGHPGLSPGHRVQPRTH